MLVVTMHSLRPRGYDKGQRVPLDKGAQVAVDIVAYGLGL